MPGSVSRGNIATPFAATPFAATQRSAVFFVNLSSLVLILLGLAVLGGWLLDVETLKSGLPGAGSMKANAAACFVFAGFALRGVLARTQNESQVRPPRRGATGRPLALVVTLLGLFTLGEWLFGWNLAIDQLLVGDDTAGAAAPGRMGANTALCFVLLGAGILLNSYRKARAAQLLACAGLVISGLAVLGYLYQVESLYGIGPYAQMAPHSALAMVLLSLGVLFTRAREGLTALLMADSAGGFVLRRMIGFAVLVPIALGALEILGSQAGYFEPEFGPVLRVMGVIIIFVVVLWMNARRIDAIDRRRSEAERQLQLANQELEKRVQERTLALTSANRELEAFAYSVSHDLRSPLRGIDGFTQVLVSNYSDKLDDKGRSYLGRVRAAAQRMGQLIDDLLKLSRLSRVEMKRTEVDLSGIAGRIVSELRLTSPERQVQVSIQQDLRAHGDPTLLTAVLDNLIGNAWKFTSKQPAARIEVGSQLVDGATVYYVRDNGAGFNMEFSDQLFGAFQRLHQMGEFPGTGIGLASVRRVIHRHGGEVWAEAEVNKGATFYFTVGAPKPQAYLKAA